MSVVVGRRSLTIKKERGSLAGILNSAIGSLWELLESSVFHGPSKLLLKGGYVAHYIGEYCREY